MCCFSSAVQCPSLPSPENGIILQDNRSYLANATVRCHDGYKHSDPEFAIRQCSGNNTWSGQDTLCKSNYCSVSLVYMHIIIIIKRPGEVFTFQNHRTKIIHHAVPSFSMLASRQIT